MQLRPEDVFAAHPEEGALLQEEEQEVGELLGAVAAQRMDELIHVPSSNCIQVLSAAASRGGRMEEAWFLFEGDSLVSLFCSKSMRRICTTHGRQSEGKVL